MAGVDIVTAEDAATFMRLNAADSQDSLVQTCVSAATPLIEAIVGPQTVNTYSEFYDGGRPFIRTTHQPLVRVDSVSEFIGTTVYPLTEQPLGSQTDAWGFTVNLLTGVIERRTFGGGPAPFMPGESNIAVTYEAGVESPAPNVTLATLALVKHLYKATLPKLRSRGGDYDDGSSIIPVGYAVPNFVLELLQADNLGPGIA